ncbi:GTPase ObgE [Latilactobacillus curvatus]|uniref:GTPase ObgE n=1 Tax=Latilactobacillus curvatus TaxID=28038 RepID=UPI001C00206C|nr:GTPase ObgE [Latilactobacillus curvatus]MCT3358472.1 GTPase ObgE [Latilactobacillus curvatus]MCT3528647.1 GTPase ObgE [Latilactobacillus curvatus]MDG2985661.1 GTPase ObgE [Latilactobacillus curvatus]QWF34960.1 GTPase ObgE [Latilactobacillus curvatus]UTB76242.1 GTPase ObgE [Latilactobacillus curvatus]
MFVDQVKIDVKAGKGGDGAVAFRREKFVPLGGPAGGDGGRGGSVILVVDEGLRTLMDFRYRHHFKANSGGNGQNKQMYGRGAEDTFVQVPPGTTVRDAETNELLGDLTEDGQQLVIAKGGRGGRGNMHFANARNSAPEVAENGEPGEERSIQLELKVLADVGLVGFPSVGKSTLLSVVTSAKPKIASYQFTTLVPNLGMVQLDDGRDFVLADLPGLIEGASDGVGLGIQFLRHVERTRVVLHLIEMDDQTGRDPFEDYQQINHELETYDPKILERPQVIVATKMDLPGSSELLAEFRQKLAAAGDTHEIFEISSITHQGVQSLMNKTADLLAETTEFPMGDVEEVQTQKLYQYQPEAPAFIIEQDEYGTFIVSGDKVEKLFKMSNLDHQDGVMRFARQLRSMGIDEALRESGAHDGDLVAIDNFTFEFVE